MGIEGSSSASTVSGDAAPPRAHAQPTHAQLPSTQRSPTPQSHSEVHGCTGLPVSVSDSLPDSALETVLDSLSLSEPAVVAIGVTLGLEQAKSTSEPLHR
jgi:hypothetical protein